MIALSTASNSRDNNFSLIRFCAAAGVFISHCFPIAGYGQGGKSQLLGFLCLNVFFIVSGFLVTKSYLQAENLWHYFKSRILRVFPALLLAVFYSVFVIGVLYTNLPLNDYFSNSQVYIYFVKNSALLFPDVPKSLPGVFQSSTHSQIVNVPLWSLPYEVCFYIALALIALVSSAKQNISAFCIVVSVLLIIVYSAFVANYSTNTTRYALIFDKETYRLASFFLFGMAFYLFRNRIHLSHLIMLALILLVGVSTLYRPTFVAVTYAALVYAIFYFAYIPAGWLRSFNRLGDYSYGIYIFGYPTQQAVASTWPELPFLIFCAITFLVTLTLAIMSWHFVERKALSLKAVN